MPKENNVRELRARRTQILEDAQKMVDTAETEDRDFNKDEQKDWDGLLAQVAGLDQRIKRQENIPASLPIPQTQQVPNILSIPRGDNEIRAMSHFIKTGDQGGVRELMTEDKEGEALHVRLPSTAELRAAVDSTMNITTSEDGGAAVPTGFARTIALRRNEIRLAERLGIRMVPGKGTTVNYPYENADPSDFAATAEQDDAHAQNFERDVAPVMANKPFTLAKKTKKLELTEELLDDEDVNLMAHVSDCIGRAIGITHNGLLITEVTANGTKLKDFASATALASGEPEDIVFNDTLGYYLDDGTPAVWVMRPTTFGAIASITGDARLYAQTPGGSFQKEILGYPVFYSNKVTAIAASAKSAFFGNWFYVGMREDPSLRIIRDPYTVDGMVILKYSFRTCYGVRIAGAVGYGQHPTG